MKKESSAEDLAKGDSNLSSLVGKIAVRIENDLNELAAKENNRLPSRTALADRYEVSRVTIQSALTYLNKQGKIRFGAGTKVYKNAPLDPGVEEDLVSPMNFQASTKKVYFWLRNSILSGHFKKGEPLPKQQYLQKKFRMSGRTLRFVANQLERDKLIYRFGKQWVVGQNYPKAKPYSALSSRSVVVVITPTWHSWLFQGRSEYSEKFCRAFEEQAMLQDIRLEQYGWKVTSSDMKPGGKDTILNVNKKQGKSLIGFLISAGSKELPDLKECIEFICSLNKPVVWFDRFGEGWKFPFRNLTCCRYWEPRLAETAIQTLKDFGHRHATFTYPFSENWMLKRFNALETHARLQGGIKIHRFGPEEYYGKITTGELTQRLKMLARNYSFAHSLLNLANELGDKFALSSPGQPVLDWFPKILKDTALNQVAPKIKKWFFITREIEGIQLLYLGMIEDIRKSDSTALILPNDYCGINMNRLFTELGIDIPGRFSLISFDNHWIGSEPLSSVDFGFSTLGHKSLFCLLGNIPGLPPKNHEVLIQPKVVFRGSLDKKSSF